MRGTLSNCKVRSDRASASVRHLVSYYRRILVASIKLIDPLHFIYSSFPTERLKQPARYSGGSYLNVSGVKESGLGSRYPITPLNKAKHHGLLP